MTNVTYLPWVKPEGENTDGSGVPAPEPSAQPAYASNIPLEIVEEPSAAALDIDQLEQTLLRKLHTADMSISEVRAWLIQHHAPEGDSLALVAKFERLGYLDDERLAQQLTIKLSTRKAQSKTAIMEQLRQRGISSACIAEAVSAISDDDQYEQALAIAAKRSSSLAKYDRETAHRRLMGFLMRRGYSSSMVRSICDQVLSQNHP